MTAILNGKTQLERVILPQLSKAIAGCTKHNEVELQSILIRWKLEATQFLYAPMPVANVAQSANIAVQTSHVSTINSSIPEDIDEPIDQELYDMTVAVMEKYPDLEGPEIAKRAAHNLEYKVPIDKI